MQPMANLSSHFADCSGHPRVNQETSPLKLGSTMHVLIHSPRSQLSSFTMADAEDVFHCITTTTARFMRWEPPVSLEAYKAQREARLRANDPSVFSFVIRRSDNKECLGLTGLDNVLELTPETGIWLKQAAYGRGYGTEAVSAVAEWAANTLGEGSPSLSRCYAKSREQTHRRKAQWQDLGIRNTSPS